jgi:hypothetical protein
VPAAHSTTDQAADRKSVIAVASIDRPNVSVDGLASRAAIVRIRRLSQRRRTTSPASNTATGAIRATSAFASVQAARRSWFQSAGLASQVRAFAASRMSVTLTVLALRIQRMRSSMKSAICPVSSTICCSLW